MSSHVSYDRQMAKKRAVLLTDRNVGKKKFCTTFFKKKMYVFFLSIFDLSGETVIVALFTFRDNSHQIKYFCDSLIYYYNDFFLTVKNPFTYLALNMWREICLDCKDVYD